MDKKSSSSSSSSSSSGSSDSDGHKKKKPRYVRTQDLRVKMTGTPVELSPKAKKNNCDFVTEMKQKAMKDR